MIKKIQVTNIKGIGNGTPNGTFEFDLHPNKPNIFVAPNGFGKSSLSIAFTSLTSTKVVLDKDHYHQGDENKRPSISITHHPRGGTLEILTANDTSNQIREKFDYFVINGQVFAKVKKNKIGGTVIASASLEVPPIILSSSIPDKVDFTYSINFQKRNFGVNGKILKNLSDLYSNKKFAKKISENFTNLTRANGQRIQDRINSFKNRVNGQNGSASELKEWICDNELVFLSETNYVSDIAILLESFDLDYDSPADYYLAAIQLIDNYNFDSQIFKNATRRQIYELEKEGYTKLFNDFNSTWKNFKPEEKDGRLIIEIPKAVHISNGQRDIMCFIALLKKAELSFNKDNCILIIDEVFDYLDEANLVSVQYYVTKFIKKLDDAGKKFYPIILTHLNPYHFKHFTFSKQKVFFLDQRAPKINQHLKKLLVNRTDATINDNLSKYHLHYNPSDINLRPQFEVLGLKATWGDSSAFNAYLNEEFTKYLDNEDQYDPFAICCAVRKKVEKLGYDKLNDPDFKLQFLSTNKTSDKLKFVESKGITIPESYYLLGLIYNDGMHWKDNESYESRIAGNLEHLTLKKMIRDIAG